MSADTELDRVARCGEARIMDITPEEYHRDPCAVPSLSSSTAKLVLKAPKLAWLRHPKLGAIPGKHTKAMDEGSIINDLLLGIEGRIVVIDAPDFRTKKAQVERDAALAQGRLPVLGSVYDHADQQVRVLRRKLEERGIVLSGRSEVAVEWEETASDGAPVRCRGMLDHLITADRGAVVYDLKKTTSADPADEIPRTIFYYGYDIQWAAYRSAVEKLHPEHAGRVDFQFLFLELGETDPEEAMVSPVALDGAYREMGRRRWQRAIDRWAECLRTGVWQEYVPRDKVALVGPPRWALNAELGEEA